MHITLIYATYSGSTMTASQVLADALSALGHQVTTQLVTETTADHLSQAEALIFASPSWDYQGHEGMPHEDYLPFMEQHKDIKIPDKPVAILGLGDQNYTHFCGAVGHLEAYVQGLEGKLVVESLKIDQFYIEEAEHTESIKRWATAISAALS
ncbi:MAG: flavodoxin family protein [Patescibacteria group bacterium]